MRASYLIRALATAALAGGLSLPAAAGGGPGDPASHQDSGTHFFGEVKNIAGLSPLEGVRVKVAITGTRMFLVALTDAEGRFQLEGFGRDVPAAKVEVTCDKSGYRTVEANRRQMGRHASSPIEVECLLAK